MLFLFLVVILLEFQEKLEINLLHTLPYLTRSRIVFSFKSLLPKITVGVVIPPQEILTRNRIQIKCQDLQYPVLVIYF